MYKYEILKTYIYVKIWNKQLYFHKKNIVLFHAQSSSISKSHHFTELFKNEDKDVIFRPLRVSIVSYNTGIFFLGGGGL